MHVADPAALTQNYLFDVTRQALRSLERELPMAMIQDT